MTEISFEVRGYPVPQGSTRAFVVKGKAVTTNRSPKLDAWRQAIAQEARISTQRWDANNFPSLREKWQLLEGALEVECAFTFAPVKSRRKQGKAHFQRPDIDKLLRAVLDACTGVIWHDDAQVAKLIGTKEYGDIPGCRITVRTCDIYGAKQTGELDTLKYSDEIREFYKGSKELVKKLNIFCFREEK